MTLITRSYLQGISEFVHVSKQLGLTGQMHVRNCMTIAGMHNMFTSNVYYSNTMFLLYIIIHSCEVLLTSKDGTEIGCGIFLGEGTHNNMVHN